MTVEIIEGDSRIVLKELADNSIHSCVTDPPYALVSISKRFGKSGSAPAKFGTDGAYARASAGFMGKTWDTGQTAFDPEFWVEVLRVLKPGGHVLAFGGTRTYHRLVCAIEDAGFEIRDQIGWAYGSGFPKSHNMEGEWGGWGTALKPAWEPICLARKPLIGTNAENMAAHGVGGLNIDGCRIEAESDRPWRQPAGIGLALSGSVDGSLRNEIEDRSHLGRWPANLIHDGSEEVLAVFPPAPGQIAKASSSSDARKNQNVYGEMKRGSDGAEPRDMGGSAARFFYCAKASKADRGEGNTHPTVKPIKLMRYLCRLITPPGGTVLDPFMGSGSTGKAADLEEFDFIGIEADAGYYDIAARRLGFADAPAQAAE